MAFVKMLPTEGKIKWIIKDGVEKVERTLSENTVSVTYNEQGYLEFKNRIGYSQIINWDADTLKYRTLHIECWAPQGDPYIGRNSRTNLDNMKDKTSIGYGGNYQNPKRITVTLTQTDPTFNYPQVYVGSWGQAQYPINIINMWLEK